MTNVNDIKIGMKVKVIRLGTIKGLVVDNKYLKDRKIGLGIVKSWVPGHGGDVWFVEQGDKTSAYVYTEFEEVK